MDLDSLVDLEQSFYDKAYEEAYAHGRIHAGIEGRAMGREKGFEIWEELGFYQGFATIWRAIYLQQNRTDDRAFRHMDQLLALINQFPRNNPPEDVDVAKTFSQIRSRYKVLCATLGVRPSLRASSDGQQSSTTPKGRQLWKLENDTKRVAEEDQGLNF